jgi:hypothetical protein
MPDTGRVLDPLPSFDLPELQVFLLGFMPHVLLPASPKLVTLRVSAVITLEELVLEPLETKNPFPHLTHLLAGVTFPPAYSPALLLRFADTLFKLHLEWEPSSLQYAVRYFLLVLPNLITLFMDASAAETADKAKQARGRLQRLLLPFQTEAKDSKEMKSHFSPLVRLHCPSDLPKSVFGLTGANEPLWLPELRVAGVGASAVTARAVLLAAWHLRELIVRTVDAFSEECGEALEAAAASRHTTLETVTVQLQFSHHRQLFSAEDEADFAEDHVETLFARLPKLSTVRVRASRLSGTATHTFGYDRREKLVLLPERTVWSDT